jgi:hypothetical protein
MPSMWGLLASPTRVGRRKCTAETISTCLDLVELTSKSPVSGLASRGWEAADNYDYQTCLSVYEHIRTSKLMFSIAVQISACSTEALLR